MKLIIHRIKAHIGFFFERVKNKNHLCSYDAWECFAVLTKIIYPYLKNFIEAKRMGYPILHKEDLIVSTEGPYDEIKDKMSQQEWEDILQQMLFAFEYVYQYEHDNKIARDLKRKLKEKYGNWKEDSTCRISLEERAKVGFELFGKYFLDLWD